MPRQTISKFENLQLGFEDLCKIKRILNLYIKRVDNIKLLSYESFLKRKKINKIKKLYKKEDTELEKIDKESQTERNDCANCDFFKSQNINLINKHRLEQTNLEKDLFSINSSFNEILQELNNEKNNLKIFKDSFEKEKSKNNELLGKLLNFKKLYENNSLSINKLDNSDNVYYCDSCNFSTYSNVSLIIHTINHSISQTPFKLKTCYFSTTFEPWHYKYKCSVCFKRYPMKSIYQHIYEFHTKEIPYQCSICLLYFTLPKFLEDHVNIFHRESTQVVKEKIEVNDN